MIGFIMVVAINLVQHSTVVGFSPGPAARNQHHMGNDSMKMPRMMKNSSLDTGIYSTSSTPILTRTMTNPNSNIIIDNQNITTPMRKFSDQKPDVKYPKPTTTEAPTLKPASKFMDPVAIVTI